MLKGHFLILANLNFCYLDSQTSITSNLFPLVSLCSRYTALPKYLVIVLVITMTEKDVLNIKEFIVYMSHHINNFPAQRQDNHVRNQLCQIKQQVNKNLP